MRLRLPFFLLILGLVLSSTSLFAQGHFGTVQSDANVVSLLGQVSLDTLQKHIRILSGILPLPRPGFPVFIPNRYSGSADFLLACDYVRDVLGGYGFTVTTENNVSPYLTTNVIGTLPGRRQAHVIICAHLDGATVNCPAADDNASGVAAMLELARVLKEYQFEYSIRVIAFGGEERGLLGSAAYANSHANDSIHAVLNADMIMWDGDADHKVQIHRRPNVPPMYAADLATYAVDAGTTYGLPLLYDIIAQGISASDHASFWNRSKSAILFIEEYGNDFNPYYHTDQDTFANANTSAHQAFFLSVTRLIGATAAHLAHLLHPVPVELQTFTAREDGADVLLRWSTVEEKDNASFLLERASESGLFSPLAMVPAGASCDFGCAYSYRDVAPTLPARYRLQQIDVDGTRTMGPTLLVSARVPQRFGLAQNYPNPVATSTWFVYSLSEAGPVRLDLLDVLGRTIAVVEDGWKDAGEYRVHWKVPAGIHGVYFARLRGSEGQEARRPLHIAR